MTQHRMDPNKEAFLIFAESYWELDNGLSAGELGKDMIMKHVKKARDSAYGYTGELDETLAHADKVIEATDRNNLKDTVDSLCDLGEIDAVTKALKNVTFGAIQKSTGVKPQPFIGNGTTKITTGLNKSPVKFNGATVNRSPVKSFNRVVNAPTTAFNRVVNDSLKINTNARSIMEQVIARKSADGRLRNPTNAAATIESPLNRQPNQEKNSVTKFTNDEDTLEGVWSAQMKKEAIETGRMKFDTPAQRSIEIPAFRTPAYNDTRQRLPF